MNQLTALLVFSGVAILIAGITRWKWLVLIVNFSCLIFIVVLEPISLVVLIFTSTISFFIPKSRLSKRNAVLSAIIILSIVFIIFKTSMGVMGDSMIQYGVPLGMSYYIFRQIHFVIESYKGHTVSITFWEYLSYLFFLPVILVGPINRITEWQREVRRRRWDPKLFSMGLERILYGFVKIVVFGNYLFSLMLPIQMRSISEKYDWLWNYLDCLRYAGNSYMQFAGYSDIAIGLALLMGIRINENFNFPFLARNIRDFWTRWHISLSEWCRDYIFMPVASYSRQPWMAILMSMIVLGLWHEISWRYLLWGTFHGIGIVFYYLYEKYWKIQFNGYLKKFVTGISIFLTVNFVIISFAWIKEDTVYDSLMIFKVLLGF